MNRADYTLLDKYYREKNLLSSGVYIGILGILQKIRTPKNRD